MMMNFIVKRLIVKAPKGPDKYYEGLHVKAEVAIQLAAVELEKSLKALDPALEVEIED